MPNRERVEFLVIDDEPAITRLVAAFLKEKGHTCETLAEGFLTGAWLELHDCEVVVVDLNMPQVDGISLISYLREIRPGLPVVVFTAMGYNEQKMHEALRAGASGYVSKNLPIEELYCVLNRLLITCRQRTRHEQLTRSQSAVAGTA
jgi:DNA-binding response OmpR family regulator